MSKKIDFSEKIKMKKNPSSLEDFLNEKDTEKAPYQSFIQTEPLTTYKREEFKFPTYLSEELRQLSYQLKKTKTDIIQLALKDFLEKNKK